MNSYTSSPNICYKHMLYGGCLFILVFFLVSFVPSRLCMLSISTDDKGNEGMETGGQLVVVDNNRDG